MYFNRKYKQINLIIVVVFLPIAILAFIGKIDSHFSAPILLAGLGLQQILWGYNYFKLQKKVQGIFSIVFSIILFSVSINMFVS